MEQATLPAACAIPQERPCPSLLLSHAPFPVRLFRPGFFRGKKAAQA